jgi:beta-galactosidase
LRAIENTSNIDKLAGTKLPYTSKTSSGETVSVDEDATAVAAEKEIAEVEVKAPVRKATVKKAPVRKKVVKKKSSRRRRRR